MFWTHSPSPSPPLCTHRVAMTSIALKFMTLRNSCRWASTGHAVTSFCIAVTPTANTTASVSCRVVSPLVTSRVITAAMLRASSPGTSSVTSWPPSTCASKTTGAHSCSSGREQEQSDWMFEFIELRGFKLWTEPATGVIAWDSGACLSSTSTWLTEKKYLKPRP